MYLNHCGADRSNKVFSQLLNQLRQHFFTADILTCHSVPVSHSDSEQYQDPETQAAKKAFTHSCKNRHLDDGKIL